jgi:hypothetical protein
MAFKSWIVCLIVGISVADPGPFDPYVFGPPGSGLFIFEK